ncbi:hypothetical protein AB8A20_20865 [Tardiphaga sp. 604_B6_N1_1]|uniref:hypothetical protein n=1 Tax=Tardiphaga sp. 604_B6_N1_1 TaxID=3240779 RepID=UPI003F212928
MAASYDDPTGICGSIPAPAGLKRILHAPIADIEAYVDTLKLSFHGRRPKGLLAELRKLSGGKAWPEPIISPDGQPRGVSYIIHQPTPELLRALDKFGGTIARIDFAFDFFPHDISTAEMAGFLRRNAILKWRRQGYPHEYEGTAYWSQHHKGERNPDRNMLEYHDKPSKLRSDAAPIAHLELRFQTAEAIKREKILKPSDIIRMSPAKLFDRHICLIDFQRHIQRDLLGSKQKRRVRGFYDRFYSLGQVFKDRFPQIANRFANLNTCFNLADTLTWGARSGSSDHLTWTPVDTQHGFIEDIEDLATEHPIIGPLS